MENEPTSQSKKSELHHTTIQAAHYMGPIPPATVLTSIIRGADKRNTD
jgi:multisubunit Na+/H+ antiporter MnhC subunit